MKNLLITDYAQAPRACWGRTLITGFTTFFLLLASTSFADVKNISNGGTIYSTLSNAVQMATSGDTLLVSTGVYHETVDINNKDLVIDGKYNDIFSEKVTSGETIISAPRPGLLFSGSVFDIINSTVFLKEIEITKGGFSLGIRGNGGGINITENSDVILYKCSIYNNFSDGNGGGIYLYNSSICASNSFVFDNTSYYHPVVGDSGCGGGLYALHSNIDLYGCKIYSNSAESKGGGIRIYSSEANVLVSTVYENSALFGGGVAAYSSTYNQKGLSFTYANTAATKGGGIFLENNSVGTVSDLAVVGYPYAYGPNLVTNGNGGGVYAADSTLILSNSANIAHNTAYDCGGGVYLTNSLLTSYSAKIGLKNSAFTNRAYFGGGVFAINSTLNFTNSLITHGIAYYGGGAYLMKVSELSNCTLSDNKALIGLFVGEGGGVYCENATVLNCIVSDNNANYGGGITCYTEANISKCVISNNSAVIFGGGVFLSEEGSVSDSIISGNSAKYGGGIFCYDDGAVTNCLISGLNTATYGGGVYFKEGGELFNCSIAGNYAEQRGGGIVCSNGGSVVNTIIYDNQAAFGNSQWLNQGTGADIKFSCTTPTTGLPNGHGCISDNPMFINPGSDYRLQEGSPCIDVGLNMSWMDPPATDLDGNPRIYAYTYSRVDIGCYEFIPEPFCLSFIIYYLLFINLRRNNSYKMEKL